MTLCNKEIIACERRELVPDWFDNGLLATAVRSNYFVTVEFAGHCFKRAA